MANCLNIMSVVNSYMIKNTIKMFDNIHNVNGYILLYMF